MNRSVPTLIAQPRHNRGNLIVVLKLVASHRRNSGLDKLSTIFEMKIPRRQLTVHAAAWNFSSLEIYLFSALLLSSPLIIYYGYQFHPRKVHRLRTQHAAPHLHDEELPNKLSEANTYNDTDLRHWHVLNASYRQLSRQGFRGNVSRQQ
jgi:hypothetical protein